MPSERYKRNQFDVRYFFVMTYGGFSVISQFSLCVYIEVRLHRSVEQCKLVTIKSVLPNPPTPPMTPQARLDCQYVMLLYDMKHWSTSLVQLFIYSYTALKLYCCVVIHHDKYTTKSAF